MMARETAQKRAFMNKIGFIKWAQIHPDDVASLSYFSPGCGRVFISPDVHSLHIVWEEPEQPSGQRLWHEIEDYPYEDQSPSEFLDDHVFDDCQGPIGWTDDAYEAISDLGEWTAENTPIIRIAELDEEYDSIGSARSLLKFVEEL